jgi:hypothetical protein
MRWLILLMLTGSALAQLPVVTGITPASPLSDYAVYAQNLTQSKICYVQDINISGTTGSMACDIPAPPGSGLPSSQDIKWTAGDSFNILATTSNGAGIISSSLLETGRTVLTSNNTTGVVTYTSAASSSLSYNAGTYSEFQSPDVACDALGNLWQTLNQSPYGGSWHDNAIFLIRVATNVTLCGGSGAISWSTPVQIGSGTSGVCPSGNLTDNRNPAFGFIPHDANGTLILFYMVSCDNGDFYQAQYMYVDNPSTSSPGTGWSSPTAVPGQTSFCASGTFGSFFLNNGQYWTVISGGESCPVGGLSPTDQYLYSTSDNGHTWGGSGNYKSYSSSLNSGAQTTNETACNTFSSDSNTVLCFTRNNGDFCHGPSGACPFVFGYTTNFVSGGATPTWTESEITNFPIYGSSGGDHLVAPSLIPVTVSGTQYGWLPYEERYGVGGTDQEQFRSLIFLPSSAISSPSTYFATLTPQVLYQETYAQALSGYQSCIVNSSLALQCWWHTFTYTTGSVPLQAATMTASIIANTWVFTQACGGVNNGTVTSSDSNVNCTCTAGTATGSCSATYENGTGPTLTATPAAGAVFSSWTNCSSASTNVCAESASTNTTVTATFNNVVPTLSMSGNIVMSGTVPIN